MSIELSAGGWIYLIAGATMVLYLAKTNKKIDAIGLSIAGFMWPFTLVYFGMKRLAQKINQNRIKKQLDAIKAKK